MDKSKPGCQRHFPQVGFVFVDKDCNETQPASSTTLGPLNMLVARLTTSSTPEPPVKSGSTEKSSLLSGFLVPSSSTPKPNPEELIEAARTGDLEAVKTLLRDSPEFRDLGGKGPLHWAALGGHEKVVQYLVEEAKVGVDETDYEKHSALHEAAYNGHLGVVEFLVQKGANVNEKDVSEETPLHKAAWNGQLEVVRFLVSKGAEVRSLDGRGEDPLRKAQANGKQDVAAFLSGLPKTRRKRDLGVASLLGVAPIQAPGRGKALLLTSEKTKLENKVAENMSGNLGLGWLLVQTLLDRKVPLPSERVSGVEEELERTEKLVRDFENGLEPAF